MSLRRTLITIALVWLVLITLIHAWLNLHLFAAKKAAGTEQHKFRIGFLPVTCHLTCPVTDFINKQLYGESFFEPMFQRLAGIKRGASFRLHYLEKRDRIFRLMGMSLRVGEATAA